jgi:hypothetical protein
MDVGMNYSRKEASDKVLEARRNGNRGRKSLIVKTCRTPVIIVCSLS